MTNKANISRRANRVFKPRALAIRTLVIGPQSQWPSHNRKCGIHSVLTSFGGWLNRSALSWIIRDMERSSQRRTGSGQQRQDNTERSPVRNIARIMIMFSMTLCLAGCFKESEAEIIAIAEKARDIYQVEAVLGEPDRVVNFGRQDDWEYVASDGRVAITVVGTRITHVRREEH